MEFLTQKEQEHEDFISDEYKCYTIGDNDLILDNDYLLKIKEFNWEPKYVEKLNDISTNKVAENVPNSTMFPLFLVVRLVFAGFLSFCILGIIKYPQYTSAYVIVSIFSVCALVYSFIIEKK